MLVNEKSITNAVKEVVNNDLSFQDSLQRDYCNISALKRSRRDYDVPEKPIASILAGSTISVKTDVAKVSAEKSKKTIEKVAKAMTQNVGNFISVSESIMSITLVFDDALLDEVKTMFAHDDVLEIEDDL